MPTRNVLVVVLEPIAEDDLRAAVRAREEAGDLAVHVVAPAGDVSVLQWLTGDEDDVRAEAEELAARTADAVDAADAEVETEVGDHDPLVAVQDALASFDADEIVVAGEAGPEVEARLRRFDLPVSRLEAARSPAGGGDGEESAATTVARRVARGRSPQTPLLLLGVVAAFVLSAVALVSLIAFLVFWLV